MVKNGEVNLPIRNLGVLLVKILTARLAKRIVNISYRLFAQEYMI